MLGAIREYGRAPLLLGVALGVLLSGAARADGTPPPAAQLAQTEPAGDATNVGKVSTGAGGNGGGTVVPSATGTRAQAKALKKDAPNEIEVQPQSEIVKLPDVNLAEALQRIPGISLETDSGEGRFINIRGLDADLNGTSFDGVRILPSNLSSPQGGGRAVAYDALPAGLVGGIEVVESLRPEDDAEGLGGAVNLLPRTPPADGKPFVNVTAGLGLETLRDTQVLDYGINGGGSFGIRAGTGPFDNPTTGSGWVSNPRPFSVFFTDTQHNDFRGVDDFEPSYSDQQSSGAPDKLLSSIDLRHYQYNRRRYSRGGEFDFDPNPDEHYYFRYAQAGYTEHAGKDILTLGGLDSGFPASPGAPLIDPADPSGKSFLAPAGSATRSNTDQSETIGNRIISWGGKNVLFDRFKLDYFGAYSEGTDYIPYSYGASFTNPQVALSYNNQSNPNRFSYHTTDGTNLLNPANYAFAGVGNSQSFSRDAEWSGAINLTVPFTLIATDEEFKTGAILRLRDRIVTSTTENYSGNYAGTSTPFVAPLTNFVSGPDLIFYNGAYNIGQSINAGSIRNLTTQPAVLATEDFAGDAQANLLAHEHDREDVYAGYVQYSGAVGKLSWLTGVRLEQTFGVYQANVLAADNVTVVPNTNKHEYVNYFPSAQLRYEYAKNFILRAIYSTALARPGFDEISAATIVDPVNNVVNIGNPSLGATYGNNFDVSAEYYLPNGGLISLAGFDKEFTGYVLPRTRFGTFNDPRLAGVPNVMINTYSTSGHSRVYGAEGNFTQAFTFLPAPYDGFGVDANFTYNQSAVNFLRQTGAVDANGNPIQATETLQLPSTSPWNFNASLFYEAHGVTFRLAAAYVSKDIFSLGATKAGDVYSQARFRLDLGTAYQVTQAVQVYFDAKNLTDTPLKFTETASAARPIQREFYGVDILGGIRASF